ncbi:NAD(P)-dependent iron-only hydrogenase iron-sulfur protein [Thermanaeromonas toyohensis ToBE]|uniref:NAD(P)-dependent iron-only hydrogenase iron-sulfur protein n=1 Tax=Thermanaeromonas toyohensis ToBE TaxID=698762 RepID=A0A1W1W0N5_9FIRM|nr:(2Fe-2S) ferredoxin domain-containing protein [Thermanaeromonas toyohensis]SMB98921.1 NAD(P)-dependent iron-only hydrogenase iron-sulfur protein [Thermanaeromonas toyohensis ToBE]
MKSLEDLLKLKEEAQKAIALREEGAKVKVVVGMGTCGIAAGAREVMTAILDELSKRRLTDVVVTQTGCIGLCAQEPLVDVFVPGKPKVTYGKVDARKARQIVAQHIANGLIIGDWVINK